MFYLVGNKSEGVALLSRMYSKYLTRKNIPFTLISEDEGKRLILEADIEDQMILELGVHRIRTKASLFYIYVIADLEDPIVKERRFYSTWPTEMISDFPISGTLPDIIKDQTTKLLDGELEIVGWN